MTEATQKKGAWSVLKSLVVEETPEAPPARNTPVPAAPRNTPLPPAPRVYQGQYSATVPAVVAADPDVLASLEKRLQKACPPEYAAVMEQYNMLKEDIPDERQRFKVALKTTHTTQPQLMGAVEVLVRTMEGAREEFHTTFNTAKMKKTAEAEASIKATQDLIASSEEQIRAIQDKIVSLSQTLRSNTDNLQSETQRLDQVAASFEAAWAQVYHELQTQKSRIDSMPRG